MQMLKIGKAAKLLGISIQTLHKWEQTGELVPDRKSNAGTRYYDADKLFSRIKFFEEKLYPRNLNNEDNPTIGYARVSSTLSRCFCLLLESKALALARSKAKASSLLFAPSTRQD
jgi:predicted site-specific integrase-resolvase